MEKEMFDEKASLNVIQKMISQSQQNFSDNAVFYLVWGWVISICAAIQYLIITFSLDINGMYFWAAGIAGAATFTVYMSIKLANEKPTKTFIDRIISGFWMGSSGVFIILMLVAINSNWLIIYPLMIAVYGWGILTSGIILKFRPLIIGGILNFFIAGVSVFVVSKEILLLLILALICSFIIPGYMLKKRS